jgi:hypothetical protein
VGIPGFVVAGPASTQEEQEMQELKLTVPTYFGNMPGGHANTDDDSDFGNPYIPVLIYEAAGVRIILGSHDREEYELPDIQVERRPNGWAIFLHPLGGGDPSGYVYFLDDGRSFLVPEKGPGPTEAIQVLCPRADLPELDQRP